MLKYVVNVNMHWVRVWCDYMVNLLYDLLNTLYALWYIDNSSPAVWCWAFYDYCVCVHVMCTCVHRIDAGGCGRLAWDLMYCGIKVFICIQAIWLSMGVYIVDFLSYMCMIDCKTNRYYCNGIARNLNLVVKHFPPPNKYRPIFLARICMHTTLLNTPALTLSLYVQHCCRNP